MIVVIVTVEERLLAVDHAGKHAAETPHVQRVVVVLQVNEQLGSLEVARGDADVVLLVGVIELSQTPVYQTQLAPVHKTSVSGRVGGSSGCALRVIDHNVVRLHVAMHNTIGMSIVERLYG